MAQIMASSKADEGLSCLETVLRKGRNCGAADALAGKGNEKALKKHHDFP